MKSVFLESHHIKNLYFGFGQFNYHLLKALNEIPNKNIEFVVHGEDDAFVKKELGPQFSFKKYYSLRRYPMFRIRKKYDLWHSMNQNTQIEPYSQIPYLLTVHNISHIKDVQNYKHLENHVKFQQKLNRSSAITYISNYAKESTHRYFDVPDVPEYVIYNGNTISEVNLPLSHKPAFEPQRPFLFTIGEITERKNFKSLVQMLEFLPEYHLVIAGKNSTSAAQEIEQLIIKMGYSDRVTLTGKISEADKQYYYKNCAAFVFPSLREGFGLPIIEAMRFGKPVITSNNTSLPEIGADVAYYWDHYDPEYMAQVLRDGLADFALDITTNTQRSTARAAEFSWQTAAQKYYEVYESLLK